MGCALRFTVVVFYCYSGFCCALWCLLLERCCLLDACSLFLRVCGFVLVVIW